MRLCCSFMPHRLRHVGQLMFADSYVRGRRALVVGAIGAMYYIAACPSATACSDGAPPCMKSRSWKRAECWSFESADLRRAHVMLPSLPNIVLLPTIPTLVLLHTQVVHAHALLPTIPTMYG
jgi:hypothetical protein